MVRICCGDAMIVEYNSLSWGEVECDTGNVEREMSKEDVEMRRTTHPDMKRGCPRDPRTEAHGDLDLGNAEKSLEKSGVLRVSYNSGVSSSSRRGISIFEQKKLDTHLTWEDVAFGAPSMSCTSS